MVSVPVQILAGLGTPGRTLAFCDETDITQEATSTMLPHVHLRAALILPSADYRLMGEELDSYRQVHGMPEFHANEIVTPGTKSAWKEIPVVERVAAFAFACELVTRPKCSIRYVHISRQQYEQMRAALPKGAIPKSYKSGVKKVFLSCIVHDLRDATPGVLVMDRDKVGTQPTLTKVADGAHLVGGGAVSTDSAAVAGLQLADVAAYVVGRYVRRRDRVLSGKRDAFDELAMSTVAAMNGRFTSLLLAQP